MIFDDIILVIILSILLLVPIVVLFTFGAILTGSFILTIVDYIYQSMARLIRRLKKKGK